MIAKNNPHSSSELLLDRAMQAADRGETTEALRELRKVPAEDKTPLALSYEAYCLASEIQVTKEALAMCRQALEEDPDNPLIYLNVGRIYLAAGYETRAIRAFRKGVTLEPHPLLLRKLGVLVPRRRPIVPFLDRANPVNVITGKLLARF